MLVYCKHTQRERERERESGGREGGREGGGSLLFFCFVFWLLSNTFNIVPIIASFFKATSAKTDSHLRSHWLICEFLFLYFPKETDFEKAMTRATLASFHNSTRYAIQGNLISVPDFRLIRFLRHGLIGFHQIMSRLSIPKFSNSYRFFNATGALQSASFNWLIEGHYFILLHAQ